VGVISKSCVLCIEKDQQSIEQQFYIINLRADWILLRYPWLCTFNLQIDWAWAKIEGGPVALKEQGVQWHEWKQRRLAMKKVQKDEAWEKGDELIICKTNFVQEWAIEANKDKCA
jgi:hypothetical protein